MKTIDEIYNELQNEKSIKELSNEWKEIGASKRKYTKISVIICAILDVFVIVFFKKIMISNLIMPLPIMLLGIVILNAVIFIIGTIISQTTPKQLNFSQNYKNIVLKKIINNFYSNL